MQRMTRRFLAVVVGLAVAGPVAADQWYEHYARAEQALIEGDHATAIAELNQALERRGDSGARVRTYGMRVVDYFPYLRLGIAYFAAGEYEAALRSFDTEEQLGAVQSSEAAYAELSRFRRRASSAIGTPRSSQCADGPDAGATPAPPGGRTARLPMRPAANATATATSIARWLILP